MTQSGHFAEEKYFSNFLPGMNPDSVTVHQIYLLTGWLIFCGKIDYLYRTKLKLKANKQIGSCIWHSDIWPPGTNRTQDFTNKSVTLHRSIWAAPNNPISRLANGSWNVHRKRFVSLHEVDISLASFPSGDSPLCGKRGVRGTTPSDIPWRERNRADVWPIRWLSCGRHTSSTFHISYMLLWIQNGG